MAALLLLVLPVFLTLFHLPAFQSYSMTDPLVISLSHRFRKDVQLVLASASPRRAEILKLMGLEFQVMPSPLDESKLQSKLDKSQPTSYTQTLAEQKALALVQPGCLVLGSDTIVEHQNQILEKPFDKAQAKTMLLQLSGDTHHVHTGVALVRDQLIVASFVDTATVKFCDISEADIDAYIETGEPMDKAGSYGIQGIGGQFVESVDGDFFTVMGLPMHRTSKALAAAIQQQSQS